MKRPSFTVFLASQMPRLSGISLRLLLASGLAVATLPSCSEQQAQAADVERPQSFPVTSPLIADVPADRQFIADVQNTRQIDLKARVSGMIEEIGADEGQRVSKGQLLFAISSHEFQSELKRCEAKLKSMQADLKMAEIELGNTRTLLEKKIIAQAEFDLAQAKLDVATAAMEEAREDVAAARRRVSWAEVRAPSDGFINRLPKKAGSMVEEGDVLTTFSSMGDVYVYFNVSEAEYLDLITRPDLHAPGALTLELADGRAYPHRGHIETRDASIDKVTGTIAFRGRFPNPENFLRHGASGKVTVHSTMKQVVVIPQKCTFEVQHKLCVYKIAENNTVELCTVEPSLRLPNHFVIQSGLGAKDKIVFEGIQLVREGDIIVPDERAWKESSPL